MTKRRRNCAVLGLLVTGLAGCQPLAPAQLNDGHPLPEFHGTLNEALGTDECSAHMQDNIEQALIVYMANNHNRLPDTLEELKQVPGFGPTVNLNCPVTGTPYIYNPAGMFLPPEAHEGRRMILWEPTASHHGSRACLFMSQVVGNRLMPIDVKLVPETIFEKAVPPIQ